MHSPWRPTSRPAANAAAANANAAALARLPQSLRPPPLTAAAPYYSPKRKHAGGNGMMAWRRRKVGWSVVLRRAAVCVLVGVAVGAGVILVRRGWGPDDTRGSVGGGLGARLTVSGILDRSQDAPHNADASGTAFPTTLSPVGHAATSTTNAHILSVEEIGGHVVRPRFYPGDGRPRPTAFILGVQKCGTSSLATELFGHPDLAWPTMLAGEPFFFNKETHFFDRCVLHEEKYCENKKPKDQTTVAFYNRHFPPTPRPTARLRYIEATPDYYYNAGSTIRNMRAAYGEWNFAALRFVVVVKDPVGRHVSYWNHFQKEGFIVSKSLNADVPSYLAMQGTSYSNCTDEYSRTCKNRLMLGCYSHFLQMWLDAGARPAQFVFVFLEEYIHARAATMRKITDHLGIRPLVFVDSAENDKDGKGGQSGSSDAHRANSYAKRETLTPHSRALLERFYAPWNCRFARLLDDRGIRPWEDAHKVAGGWFPSRAVCDQRQKQRQQRQQPHRRRGNRWHGDRRGDDAAMRRRKAGHTHSGAANVHHHRQEGAHVLSGTPDPADSPNLPGKRRMKTGHPRGGAAEVHQHRPDGPF